ITNVHPLKVKIGKSRRNGLPAPLHSRRVGVNPFISRRAGQVLCERHGLSADPAADIEHLFSRPQAADVPVNSEELVAVGLELLQTGRAVEHRVDRRNERRPRSEQPAPRTLLPVPLDGPLERAGDKLPHEIEHSPTVTCEADMEATTRVSLEVAAPETMPVLGNLLELYQHDLSECFRVDPGPDGRFGYERLPLYWSEPERRFPFLIRCDSRLA